MTAVLATRGGDVGYFALSDLDGPDPRGLPATVLVLLEMQLRWQGPEAALRFLARYHGDGDAAAVPFRPTRIVCQDHSGVPALLDLAAMRWGLHRAGLDPRAVEPVVPVDLVVDHSVEAFAAGSPIAIRRNIAREYAHNEERYAFLRWAERAFDGVRVVPPGKGIVHQLHLEHLARVVALEPAPVAGPPLARPDTVLGTDSHTPMINSLGVLGFGVGGIDATAAMLGRPPMIAAPEVVAVRLEGAPAPGVTVTDLVLAVTERLRGHGVIGRFLEFRGPGVAALSVHDRATLANMAPEYGATCALFPVDGAVLDYLRLTRGDADHIDLVERYTKEQGLFREGTEEVRAGFADEVVVDLAGVEPCAAGPRRPQDRLPLRRVPASLPEPARGIPHPADGDIAIAAITSCTNTSNPGGMIIAGLVARNAVRLGLRVPERVKTSLAPGSRTVTRYLEATGLLPHLEKLGFHVVGYGCTTCIGNSGPLTPAAAGAAGEGAVLAAVLSGNRNFEGRIHADVRAAYLASPGLVVAWALAGSVRTDLETGPLAHTPDGEPVTLADLWPDPDEVAELAREALGPELYLAERRELFAGDAAWESIETPEGELFSWDETSTYLLEPPFFDGARAEGGRLADIRGARVLVYAGDSFTTDHISPAGGIPTDTPAGRYLIGRGVEADEFGTYGCRRGNHEVLARGTFANVRLANRLVPGRTGGRTRVFPGGEEATVYDAAVRYAERGVPLVVLAGRDYGMGSSRDWAAKGPALLGVRAILARGFERIHRSNLVGMGVLPLELPRAAEELGLTGEEEYDVLGLADVAPGARLTVRARPTGGPPRTFEVTARLDSAQEVEYLRRGGVLRAALADLVGPAGGGR